MENCLRNFLLILLNILNCVGYTLAVNHLADKTDKELKALYGKQYSGIYNGGQPFPYSNVEQSNLPEQFDWRIYGAVTPVKGKRMIEQKIPVNYFK